MAQDEKSLRNDVRFTVVNANKAGGLKFRSAELARLNDEHAEMKADYDSVQRDIVAQLLRHAGPFPTLTLSLSALTLRRLYTP